MADAQASGACGSNIVWVQVPSPAYQTSAESAEVFSCSEDCDKEGPTKWEDALLPSNKTEFCYRIQNKEPRKNIILDSSMVEHSAVNRVVAGSSPARGARAKEESGAAVPKLKRIRLRGQAVKTSPFHGGNTGSIPVGVIFFIYKKINMAP